MTDADRHLMTIFSTALERGSDAERAAYLTEACGDNSELRQRVEALLQAHSQAGEFLEPRRTATFELPGETTAAPQLPAGAVIAGRYKLVEQIGEGGMGSVWMAQQTEPVRRPVALKLIKPGMDSKQVLARFEAERQALALMDHPDIAKVLDGGMTPEGRPYFVMELVKGMPITKYCDEHKLTPRQRLELFIPVCQAVQHAHQKGIIHRDIKPSNILIALYDGRPVPKVIDFGVAKAAGQQLTDKTLMTGFGSVVGTLEYMSPEQAEMNQLDIDTRSDIYSLGVVLYELLTGSTPLDRKRLKQAAFAEILRVIREEEPQKPSTRLSHSTDSLPSVSAQRQTEPGKLTKLVRGELDWIVMKALEKDRNRRYETANGFAMDVQRYLADEPVHACPPSAGYRARKFARRNRTALAVAGLILFFVVVVGAGGGWVVRDRAARRTRAINDLELALDRAELFQGQGKRAEAMTALDRAELLAADFPENSDRAARLAALKDRFAAEERDQVFLTQFEKIRLNAESSVNVKDSTFAGETALTEYRDAFEKYGMAIGAGAPAEAAALIRSRPEPIRRELVAALDRWRARTPLSDSQTRQWLTDVVIAADGDPWRLQVRKVKVGDWQTLERLAREVDVRKQPPSFLLSVALWLPADMKAMRLDLLRRVQRAYPADLWANHTLAVDLQQTGQPAEAVRYYTAASALRPENPGIYLNRGNAFREAGERDAAIADERQAIAIAPDYTVAHMNLGLSLVEKKLLDEAIAEFREAIRLNKDLVDAHFSLGVALMMKGRLDEAVDACREAVRINRDNAEAHAALARVLGAKGLVAEALAEAEKATRLAPTNHRTWVARGRLYTERLGQHDKAIAFLTKALELNPNDVEALNERGNAYSALKQGEKALADCSRVVELVPKDAMGWCNRGTALNILRRTDEALASFAKALELEPKLGEAWFNRGNTRRDLKQWDLAIADFSRAIDLDFNVANARFNRGNCYLSLGQYDRAAADYGKVIELEPKNAAAWNNRGEAYKNLRQWDKAVADFSQALALDPKDTHPWANRAMAYIGLRQWDKAVLDLTRLIELDPRAYDSWLSRGAIYCDHLNQQEKAVADFTHAIELNAKSTWVWYCRGNALSRLGQWDQAIPDFTRAVELDRANKAAWHARGNGYARLGQWDKAIADYARAIEVDPKFVAAVECLVRLLASCPEPKFRDPVKAVEMGKKLVELAPGDFESWNALGIARYRAGEWKEAIATLEKSVELGQGGNALDWFFLAMAQKKLGNQDQARKAVDRAIEWSQDNKERVAKNRLFSEDVPRFRSEAEELLELKKK